MKNKVTVLLVDDNKDFCGILDNYLKSEEGIEVVGTAHDGFEGIEMIKKKQPDLVVLDVVMPKADGLAVLEELLVLDLKKKPKVIMLSAVGQDTTTIKCLELGASYYVIKPFDFDVFVRRIRSLFEEGQKSSNMIRVRQEASSDGETVEHQEKSVSTIDYQEKNMSTIDHQITQYMHDMGIPAHVRGYLYVKRAIEMVLEDVNLLNAITKELYPRLAEEFSTTPSRVERAIRHAIEIAWTRGNQDTIVAIFGLTKLETKPTNSHFIACIASRINMLNN